MKRICIKIITCIIAIFICTSTVLAGEWVQDGENWKYLDDTGNIVTSSWKFLSVNGNYGTYYFDEVGNMATGLKRIEGEVYAFNDDGTTKTNSSITIDGDTFQTKNKGLVEGIPDYFDVEEYNSKIKAEKQRVLESIAKKKEEQQRIAESIANRSPEELAAIAASEAAVEAERKAKEDELEAKRIAVLNNTIRLSKTLPDSVTVKGEGDGKITITLLIPTLVGGNSEQINAVLKDKIKNAVYTMYEEKYGESTAKLSFKVKDLKVEHDLDSHTLTFRFLDANGFRMFTLYMDTNSLEMWGE